MMDFPTSPTVGTIANSKIWDGTAWKSFAHPIDPAVGGPYTNVRQNDAWVQGIWKRRVDISQPPVYVSVPPLATLMRWSCSFMSAVSINMFMRISYDGVTYISSGAYGYTQVYHETINGTFGKQAPIATDMMYLSTATTDNSPCIAEGIMNLTRPTTATAILAKGTSMAIHSSFGLINWEFMGYTTAGTGLAVKSIMIDRSQVGNMNVSSPDLVLEWIA